jgi:hypothetical protein
LLEKGVYRAARECLSIYNGHQLKIARECLAEGASSTVDYVVLVDNDAKALCEATSPSVMKTLGESLPPRGIELKWVRGQSVVPEILSEVCMPFAIGYDAGLKDTHTGRFISRAEKDGVAVPYMPQLLDSVPSCPA